MQSIPTGFFSASLVSINRDSETIRESPRSAFRVEEITAGIFGENIAAPIERTTRDLNVAKIPDTR